MRDENLSGKKKCSEILFRSLYQQKDLTAANEQKKLCCTPEIRHRPLEGKCTINYV